MNFFVRLRRGLLHSRIAHTIARDLVEAAEVLEVGLKFAPIPAPAEFGVEALLNFVNSKVGEPMNPLEMFAVTMVLGLVQQVVKNPVHAAQLQNQLIGIADQIYIAYGRTPAAAPSLPTVPPQTPAAHSGQ